MHLLADQTSTITLAVDCMGGDYGVVATLPACVRFLKSHPQALLRLVGLPQTLDAHPELASHPRCQWVDAAEVVGMDDTIEAALRHKKKSSMRVAIEQVRDGTAQAAVSAGNTGALMAIARYVLKTMHGIDRPAIASQLPNQKGGATTVLDLGANIDCQPDHLVQFAIMGAAFTAAINGARAPLVGLLNVGEEVIKGGDILRQTGERLRHMSAQGQIQFHGNVEGNDIFKGTVDVVVCDGFVGNVALKASEGVASMMGGMIREEFSRSPWRKLAGLVAYPVLKAFKMRVDHRRYNGAALLGLRGLVFKSHGSADDVAFEHALHRAYAAVQGDLLQLVRTQIETLSMKAHTNQPVTEL